MKITLRFKDEHSTRIAEREFEWEEEMGNKFLVPNPENPQEALTMLVLDNQEEVERIVCDVTDEHAYLSFEDILQYGFVEVEQIQT